MIQEVQSSQDVLEKFGVSDEIDIAKVFATLWEGKWFILGVTLFVCIVAIALVLRMPDEYRATTLLAPAEDAGDPLSSVANQLGGLAGLAGVDIGGGAVSKATLSLEVLRSRAFITSFVRKHELVVPLLAGVGWDKDNSLIIIDEEMYDEQNNTWKDGYSAVPSDWNVFNKFSSMVQIAKSSDTGLVVVSLDSVSPVYAHEWLELLIADVNEHMRRRDIGEANKSIEYLEIQLDKTPLADMKQIFYKLIEKQMQTIMLANVRNEYVFKIIDPSVVPEEKIRPKRVVILSITLLFALLFSIAALLVRSAIRDKIS